MSSRVDSSTGKNDNIIDTLDHNGLRGILAIWVVLFHCFQNVSTPVDIQGSSLMSMFYLLSGFSLTIGYYTKLIGEPPLKDDESAVNQSITTASEDSPLLSSNLPEPQAHDKANTGLIPTVTYSNLIINRLLRVMPVYYVGMILSIPLYYVGFTESGNYRDTIDMIETYVTNIIPSTTWFAYYFGGVLDIPSWTIQTLIGMWLMFPPILQYCHGMTDRQLLKWICYCFWIQMILCIVGIYSTISVLGHWHAIAMFRFNPLSRIWVFMMGVFGGMLCLKYRKDGSMPWFDDAYWFFPMKSSLTGIESVKVLRWDSNDFHALMFNQTYVLLIVTATAFIADAIARLVFDMSDGIGTDTWMEGVVPFAQLNVMIAMVRHKDPDNMISKFLRGSWMQWLGELSMSVYLLHYPIMLYILWARYNFKTIIYYDDNTCSTDFANDDSLYSECETYYTAMTWPYTAFLYLPLLAVLLASIVYRFIEKPFHNMKFSN